MRKVEQISEDTKNNAQLLTRRAFLGACSFGAASALLVNQTGCVKFNPDATAASAALPAPPNANQIVSGANLIGHIEGPVVVTDPALYPPTFKETPELAEMVKQGKLPPIAERLPRADAVLVIKPVHETGRHGGIWRRGFTGPGDRLNGCRTAAHDHILFFDHTVSEVVPNVARGWEVSNDGRLITLRLREGMKWSDGHPFTADDFVFWFDDVYSNRDLVPTPVGALSINGKPGRLTKIDDYAVRYEFDEPYFMFPEVIAGFSEIASHANWGYENLGGFCPAHYLKQFHPKYATLDELKERMRRFNADNATLLFKRMNDWSLNPELPCVTPWKTKTPVNSGAWTLERNPYFYAVDTEGNQLPYIDSISMTLAEDLEVLNLRAIAGTYDLQDRHVDLQKLPLFLENRDAGDYDVHLDPGDFGSVAQIRFGMSYENDPEIARWFHNVDFRRALSLGINRQQINEAFFLELGKPSSPAPADDNKYFPGAKYRDLWHTHNPEEANRLLDAAGLTNRDDAGFRLRSDGNGRLTLEAVAVAGSFAPYTKIGEMIAEHWKSIGVDLNVKEMERNAATSRNYANDTQLFFWDNGGTERLFGNASNLFASGKDLGFGLLYGQWFASGGKQGKEPPAEMRRIMELWQSGKSLPERERVEVGKQIWRIYVEQVFVIGLVGFAPVVQGVRVAKRGLGNVPSRQVFSLDGMTLGNSRPETFYWKA